MKKLKLQETGERERERDLQDKPRPSINLLFWDLWGMEKCANVYYSV